MPLCGDIHHAIGDNRCVADLIGKANLVQNLLLLACLHNPDVPLFSAYKELAVRYECGTPERRLGGQFPAMSPCLTIQAMNVAAVIRNIYEVIHYGYGRQAAVYFSGLPDDMTVFGVDAR